MPARSTWRTPRWAQKRSRRLRTDKAPTTVRPDVLDVRVPGRAARPFLTARVLLDQAQNRAGRIGEPLECPRRGACQVVAAGTVRRMTVNNGAAPVQLLEDRPEHR